MFALQVGVMIVTTSNKGLFKISDEPFERMNLYKQDDRKKLEAGGVLLGRLITNSKNIIVDRVTVPMIGDKRGKYEFIRGEKMHQQVITNAWEKSNGRCNYLGEWHTHPESYPSPSRKDYENWLNILENRVYDSFFLYFVIVGTRETRIWEGNRKEGKRGIKRIR